MLGLFAGIDNLVDGVPAVWHRRVAIYSVRSAIIHRVEEINLGLILLHEVLRRVVLFSSPDFLTHQINGAGRENPRGQAELYG